MDLHFYMKKCLQLAKLGEYYVAPNPMVGAVLVEGDRQQATGDRIIGEGWHKDFGGPHAEVNCFRDAEERGYTDFTNCTLFVSLEPCSHYGKTPPCANLIIEKGVKRVVVGMQDPNPLVAGKGIEILRNNGIEVVVGVLENECRELNKRFLMLHEHQRPYVILKWAQTKDGYIDKFRGESLEFRGATPNGDCSEMNKPLVISTPVTKQLVHKMRAENMAIMVGTNTVIKDNPKLNVTRWAGRNPIRVTLDRGKRIEEIGKRIKLNIFDNSAPTIVYRENTEWEYILSDLAKRGIHSILIEGGTTLLNHILATGIYDEIHVEVADFEIGSGVKAPEVEWLEADRRIGRKADRQIEIEEIDNHRLYIWRNEEMNRLRLNDELKK